MVDDEDIKFGPVKDSSKSSGYKVKKVSEAFEPSKKAAPAAKGAPAAGQGPSLNTQTMADIYVKQGHYEKAYKIYIQLYRKDPKNALIKKRAVWLQKKLISLGKLKPKAPAPAKPAAARPAGTPSQPAAAAEPAKPAGPSPEEIRTTKVRSVVSKLEKMLENARAMKAARR